MSNAVSTSSRAPPEEHVVFGETVEGLVKRALKGRMTPALRARFLDAGLDLDQPYQAQYPKAMWLKLLRASTEECYPGMPPYEAYYALGVATFEGFGDTLMGRFLFKTLKLLGSRRTLNQLQRQFRSVNNYLETRSEELAPNHFEVWLSECHGNPGFLSGVIFRGLLESGAEELKVKVKVFDGLSATLDISWK